MKNDRHSRGALTSLRPVVILHQKILCKHCFKLYLLLISSILFSFIKFIHFIFRSFNTQPLRGGHLQPVCENLSPRGE